MFNELVLAVSLLAQDSSELQFRSIHQIELTYNKANYLEPAYKTYTGPADPIKPREKGPSRMVFGYHPYWQGTKWQNYQYDLLTTIAYFSAEANAAGQLIDLHGCQRLI